MHNLKATELEGSLISFVRLPVHGLSVLKIVDSSDGIHDLLVLFILKFGFRASERLPFCICNLPIESAQKSAYKLGWTFKNLNFNKHLCRKL